MRRALPVFLLLGLATGAPLAAAGSKVVGVQSVDQAFTKALLAGDAAALASLYADDAVLVMPGSPAINGGKAIAETFTGWLKGTKVMAFTMTPTGHRTEGSLSTGWGTWTMTSAPRAGGAPTTETGTYSEVALKRDGVWRYVSDHAAADPTPPAKP